MKSEIIIIGAGITGLAAGMELKDRAVVLEKGDHPGGLVRTFNFDGYWFDNVVHLLHFRNSEIESYVKSLMGNVLKSCPPTGWVETSEGKVRYPFQLNLGGLNIAAQLQCLFDFIRRDLDAVSSSYKEFLINTFGRSMCEIFFFPYNRKLWNYNLDEMTAVGQIWNITQPSIREIFKGITCPDRIRDSYNSNAYYPQSDVDAELRGMEILSRTMAGMVGNLRLSEEVLHILPRQKIIVTKQEDYFYDNCLSTIPLPRLMKICDAPKKLMNEVNKLKWITVNSIALSVKGKRQKETGLWHYYSDPDIVFTKVIFMTEFDGHNAPPDGFGLLIEVPGKKITKTLIKKAIADLKKVKVLTPEDVVIGVNSWLVNPAYIIFTKETPQIVEDCKWYFEKFNITTLGRYGSWEYSSMAENIEEGLDFAKQLKL